MKLEKIIFWQFFIYEYGHQLCTMLQTLSKCEVKAARCRNFYNLPATQIWPEIKFQ